MEDLLEAAVEQQSEARDKATEDWYLDGMTDAAFAYLPQHNNDAYLMGYCRKIKELPTVNGRVAYDVTIPMVLVSEDEEF